MAQKSQLSPASGEPCPSLRKFPGRPRKMAAAPSWAAPGERGPAAGARAVRREGRRAPNPANTVSMHDTAQQSEETAAAG